MSTNQFENNGFGGDVNEEMEDEVISSDEPEGSDESEEGEEGQEKSGNQRQIDPEIKARLNQIRREKYEAINETKILHEERARLLAENELLRRQSDTSAQAALTQYQTSAVERLDRAKQIKAQAIESGDINAQIEADIALTSAVTDYSKIADWQASENVRQEQEYNYAEIERQRQQMEADVYRSTPPEVLNRQVAETWVAQNPWWDINSRQYDPSRAKVAEEVLDLLDRSYTGQGMRHMMLSSEYFEQANQLIAQRLSSASHYQSQDHHQHQSQRRPQMKPSRSPVAPVRSGVNSTASQPRLSAEELDFCRRGSIDPNQYKAHKQEIIRKDPDKWYGRR